MDNWKHKKAREKINVETLKNKQNQIFHILEKNYGKVELIMKINEGNCLFKRSETLEKEVELQVFNIILNPDQTNLESSHF